MLTVHRALEALNFDVLIYNSSELQRAASSSSIEELLVIGDETRSRDNEDEGRGMYCLLTFDIRNMWNRNFEISFRTNEGAWPT